MTLAVWINWLTFETFCRLVGLIIILWLSFTHLHRRSNARRASGSRDHNFCSNPDCVRCQGADPGIHLKRKARILWEQNPVQLARLKRWASGDFCEDAHRKPTIFYLPDLQSSPFVAEGSHSHDVRILEANWKSIRSEFEEIWNGSRSPMANWTVNSTPKGCWSVYYLYNQGKKVGANCRLCPNTVTMLERLENLMVDCSFGNVCFTVLDPGTAISAHYGPCNVRVRCHLGLQIPPGFSLVVGEAAVTWSEGKCLLFDDSYLHSVLFDPNVKDFHFPRVVFMVDLWHFGVNAHERKAIQQLFPST